MRRDWQITMKYGKDLEENAVRRYLPHYIDYMRLKELLKGAKDAIHNKAPSAEAVMASKSMERRTTLPNNVGTLAGQKAPFDMAEVTFMKAVDRELERVNGFAVAKAKELRASLIDALSKLEREGLGNTLALYEGTLLFKFVLSVIFYICQQVWLKRYDKSS